MVPLGALDRGATDLWTKGIHAPHPQAPRSTMTSLRRVFLQYTALRVKDRTVTYLWREQSVSVCVFIALTSQKLHLKNAVADSVRGLLDYDGEKAGECWEKTNCETKE